MDLLALDFVIIAVLLISASLSLIRGFTKEVLSITGWVVSSYAAIFLGPSLKPVLANYTDIGWVITGGAMLIVFLIVLVVFSIGGGMIASQLKGSSLGPLDRSLGILFGAARGLFIICTAYLGISSVIPEKDHPDFIADAKLRPMLQTGSKTVVAIVPLDRLPLNLANIGETVKGAGTDALQQAGEKALKQAIEQELGAVSEDAKATLSGKIGQETQDSAPDKGYKQTERDQIERLIRNTEGVSQ